MQPEWMPKAQARLHRIGSGLFFGLIIGLYFGLFDGLFSGLFSGLDFGLVVGLSGGLVFGLVAGGSIGLVGGGIVGLIIGLDFGLVGGLLGGLVRGLDFGLVVGLFGGGIVGLNKGGSAYIQHGVLRVLLWRHDYAPLNYVRFLDHAVEQLFLRKVGGGYIFVHRLLMEHFAAWAAQPAEAEADMSDVSA